MHHVHLTMICCLLAGAAGCDRKGSLGNYTDSDDVAGSGQGGATAAATGGEPTDSATSDSATSGSATSGSATSVGDDEGPTATDDDGTPGVCEAGCAIECIDARCGPLGQHHEDGCLRRPCQRDDACDDGDRCYIPVRFGGCASSGWDCFDEGGNCMCGGDADCGGGYCVDAADFPEPVDNPGAPGRVQPGCAPDDGPAIDIHLGVDTEGCGSPFEGTAELRVSIIEARQGELGTFSVGGTGPVLAWYDLEPGMIGIAGDVTITSYEGGVDGNYDIWVSDDQGQTNRYLAGSFEDLPFCDVQPACG